jgi:hypothetical protein
LLFWSWVWPLGGPPPAGVLDLVAIFRERAFLELSALLVSNVGGFRLSSLIELLGFKDVQTISRARDKNHASICW